jgi:hypothetical protein
MTPSVACAMRTHCVQDRNVSVPSEVQVVIQSLVCGQTEASRGHSYQKE